MATSHFLSSARAAYGGASLSDSDMVSQFLESDMVELVHNRRLPPTLRTSLQTSFSSSTTRQQQQQPSSLGSRFPLLTSSQQQPIILQVNDVSDVSMALAGRVGAVKGGTRGDAQAGPQGGSRLLKLLLTDGQDTITAVEVRSCPMLSQVKIGSKVAVLSGCIVRWLVGGGGGGGSAVGGAVPEPSHCSLLLTSDSLVATAGIVKQMALQHSKLQRQVASSLEGRAPLKQFTSIPPISHQHHAGGIVAPTAAGNNGQNQAEEPVHAVASTVRYAPTKTTLLNFNRQQQPQPPPVNPPNDVSPPIVAVPAATAVATAVVAEDVDDWDDDGGDETQIAHSHHQHDISNNGDSPSDQIFRAALGRIVMGGGTLTGGGANPPNPIDRAVAEVILRVVQYGRIKDVCSGIYIRDGGASSVSPYESLFLTTSTSTSGGPRYVMLAVVDGGGGGGGQVVDLGHELVSSEVLKGRWSPYEFQALAQDASRSVEYEEVVQEALAALTSLPPLYFTLIPISSPSPSNPYQGSPTPPLSLVVQATAAPPPIWEEAADAVLAVNDEN